MKILVTGSAGFIGFHLTSLLLEKGYEVVGVDNFNNYYDPNLKKRRVSLLKAMKKPFIQIEGDISCVELNEKLIQHQPSIIVHLAAQAGVRYSLENSEAYINSNPLEHFAF